MLHPSDMRVQRVFDRSQIAVVERRHDRTMLVLRCLRVARGQVVDARAVRVGMQLRVGANETVVAGRFDYRGVKILIVARECLVILKIIAG